MPRNKANEAKEAALRKRCVDLRLRGGTYREIAEEAGCSLSHAWRLVTRAVEAWNEEAAEGAEVLRRIEAERLDGITRRLWPLIDCDDPALPAVDRMLRVMERRAKLLGLDAPAKIAPTNPEGDAAYNPYEELADADLLALARAVVDNASGDADGA